jgi:hypothetical protein
MDIYRVSFRSQPISKEQIQPSPSRSEASARKNVDVVRDWDLESTRDVG